MAAKSTATATSARWSERGAEGGLDPGKRGRSEEERVRGAGGQRRGGSYSTRGHAMVRHRGRGGMGAGHCGHSGDKKMPSRKPPQHQLSYLQKGPPATSVI